MKLADEARQYWSASFFIRRAPERDHKQAFRILRHLSRNAQGKIAGKASAALAELENGAGGA